MYYVIDLQTNKIADKFDFKGDAESFAKALGLLNPTAMIMVIDDTQADLLGAV